MGVGSSFFPFSSEVPLYLRDHPTRQRMDAEYAGRLVADYGLDTPEQELRQSISSAGDEPLELELIYEPRGSGGDIWQVNRLNQMRKVEEHIQLLADYPKFCLMNWGSRSAANATVAAALNENPPPCAPPRTAVWGCARGSCEDVAAEPPGLLDCKKPPCTKLSDFEPVEEEFKNSKLRKYSQEDPFEAARAARLFYSYTDATFGGGVHTGKASRTVFRFGLPLEGYKNSEHQRDEQIKKVKDFLFDQLEWLFEQGTDEMYVWWSGLGLEESYILQELPAAASWAVFSFLFVLFYMSTMTQSWFLALMGMGQILMSFAPSYFLYFMFGQRYFGTFNMLSIFIILGIGADDLFVFLDTWNQSYQVLTSNGEDPSFHMRMSYAWSHSAKAMLVTSLSTIASFLATSTSSFPAISTFGIFSALLVFVNYCAVITYFPTVVAVYHTRFEVRPAYCCGLCAALNSIGKNDHGVKPRAHTEDADLGAVEYWFKHKFAGELILHHRRKIVFVFGLLLIVFLVFAGQLKPDPDVPKLFKSGHNVVEFPSRKAQYFARGGSIYSIGLEFVLGFDKDNPIDRTGTRATNTTDVGTPVWHGVGEYDVRPDLDCFIEFCNHAEIKNDVLKIGGAPEYIMDCPWRDFRDYLEETEGANFEKKWAAITGPNGYLPFLAALEPWITVPEVWSAAKPLMFAEEVVEGDVTNILGRFYKAEMQLTTEINIDFSDGIKLWTDWEEWMTNGPVWDTPQCQGKKDRLPVFVGGPAFSMFFVQEKMVAEAFQGIGLSLLFAWIILTLPKVGTGNIIIGTCSTLVIATIVACVIGFTVMLGWKLGILESIVYVMVPGMSVDYVAHLAEAYNESPHFRREDKVVDMLTKVGVSVVSGACSTLGASVFLFFPTIVFFVKFGAAIFATIFLSLVWSLLFFAAVLAWVGPQGDAGKYMLWCTKNKTAPAPTTEVVVTSPPDDNDDPVESK